MNPVRLVLMLLALLAIAACGDKVEYDQVESHNQPAAEKPAAMPAAQPAAEASPAVEVLETMNSGGYTYVRYQEDGKDVWAAGPETEGIAVGDAVLLTSGMLMKNFHANSIDRDFEEIWFVGGLQKAGDAPVAAADPHAGMDMGGMTAEAASHTIADNAGIEAIGKVDGGYAVAEIHEQAAALSGQKVKVRGQVVKFTPNIMGTNWIHLQDGTGEGKTGDLTVTSSARAEVGDVIVVEGPLSVDKDFGAGYFYSVIIEGAEVLPQ